MRYEVEVKTNIISTIEVEADNADEAESMALNTLERAMCKAAPHIPGDPDNESRWGCPEMISIDEIGD